MIEHCLDELQVREASSDNDATHRVPKGTLYVDVGGESTYSWRKFRGASINMSFRVLDMSKGLAVQGRLKVNCLMNSQGCVEAAL